jgi:serine/threonine protein kinase
LNSIGDPKDANNPKVSTSEIYFAVKELKNIPGYKEEREAKALKLLNDVGNPHLIRLLATYTHRGRFNFIFPWADGNLIDFWKTPSPGGLHGSENRGIVMWMSSQILALAKAVQDIHHCKAENSVVQDATSEQPNKLHGRHGDLKPENILWFNSDASAQKEALMGLLKIGDLGFADFHSEQSRSKVRQSAVAGMTDTYSAPELYVTQKVSPQFDIWSFGCILLQFVVWYVHGWTGIEDFAARRIKESKGFMINLDNFYNFDWLEDKGSRRYKARAKASVAGVRNFEICSYNGNPDPT